MLVQCNKESSESEHEVYEEKDELAEHSSVHGSSVISLALLPDQMKVRTTQHRV